MPQGCRKCLMSDISDGLCKAGYNSVICKSKWRSSPDIPSAGYNSAICKSKWRSSPDIPSGEHTYIDVVDKNMKKGENNWEVLYKHKQMSGLQPLGDESKLTSESNQLTIWSNSQTTEGSSSRMHSGGSGISPYWSEAIQSPFHEGMGFLGIPKQVKSIKVNNSISYKDGYWGSDSLSLMVEKTVYVDSEHLQTSIAKSSSLDMSGMVGFKENDSVILTEHFEKEDMLAVSCSGDLHNLDLPQEKKISKPKFSEVGSPNLLSSSDRPNPARHRHSLDGFRNGDVLDQEARSFMSSNVRNSGDLDFEKPQFLREVYQEKCSKPPSIDQTWETIVKTSNVYHSHLQFSEVISSLLYFCSCTRDGRIKLLGKDITQALLQSNDAVPSKFMQVWDIERKQLCDVFMLKEDITSFTVVQQTSYAYIGDSGGNISVLKLDLAKYHLVQMNYRIPLSASHEWSKLTVKDQTPNLLELDMTVVAALRELKKGRAFDGWTEGALTFPPTYKYEFNSSKYRGEDPKSGRRNPAWCDRILSFGKGTRLLNYNRVEEMLSDHWPVKALYIAEVEVFCHKKLQKVLAFTDPELKHEDVPYVENDIGMDSLWFGKVMIKDIETA
ncbi:hypothetical protein IFM89_002788 [Coptis chinensis]|uniref:Inositol polyphosphate-related phosphatase domain-containing protein n=1 Tax=Coptis chinensis TaxID=261450 RepID=A0A835HTN5_9MAGN|nr:hypothetical protein IFM89_002788 [Coptis chinensis]